MNSSENVPGSAGWTLLTLVVDRSGSMADIKVEMERGIRALIEEQARGEERCFVTLTQFYEHQASWPLTSCPAEREKLSEQEAGDDQCPQDHDRRQGRDRVASGFESPGIDRLPRSLIIPS